MHALIDRRRFLVLVPGLGAVALGCAPSDAGCATPSASTTGYCLVAPVRVRVRGAGRLQPGQAVLSAVDDKTAVVVLRDAGGWYAVSGICTHACCIVSICEGSCGAKAVSVSGECASSAPVHTVSPGAALFCACHGSEFDANGVPLSGPATKPLPAFAVTREGDDCLVDTGRAVPVQERVA